MIIFFNPTFCKIRIGAIAYADDIALVSRSIYGIQSLVARAHNHSKKWRYDFNASKCALLMFPKNVKENVNVYLGNEIIPIVNGEKHLGVYLSESTPDINKVWDKIHIKSCESICYTTQGLSSHRIPVNPLIRRKNY